ncbi:MAG: ABC transporter ATP-binding protein [Anaerolineaceae bacterium]|nr:ABC transporter ATP-binding protein [Anaerolineaceae bacterium]
MHPDEQTSPALTVAGITKHYKLYDRPGQRLLSYLLPGYSGNCRTFCALEDINFELRQGETLGIIGRNGSGKSTLLQIISGTLRATAGTVQRQGRVAALLELGAGFNPDFTGRENAILNAAIHGLSEEEIEARLPEIIEFAGIGDFIDQPVRHYSSGMFVRLAFSVIVHVDADVLIIDEALAVGDVLFSQKCMRFLDEFKSRGSILFVSHDAGAISQLCDRVVWLDSGRQMGLGEPREMLDRYLEHIYGEQQAVAPPALVDGSSAAPPVLAGMDFEPWHDARESLLNSPQLFNSIEVCRFNESAKGFGDGGATILDVCFRDEQGRKLSGIVGGAKVALCFRFQAHRDLQRLIVGFLIKDRLGQVIFGDNNCIVHHDDPVHAEAGKVHEVRFGLTMPYLAISEYIVSVSVASGTQTDHVQHCWLHDALVFHAEKGHVVHGIMGIPMAFCTITTAETDSSAAEAQGSHQQGIAL